MRLTLRTLLAYMDDILDPADHEDLGKKIEALFGEAKHILSIVRLRLRGLAGVRDEFLLTATVQNLIRLAAR